MMGNRRPVTGPPADGGIDCVITQHAGLPRDGMGNRLSMPGRWLIRNTLGALYGMHVDVDGPARLTTDEHRRWSLPAQGLNISLDISVSHVGALSVVAVSAGTKVGVDVQDVRPRPGALAWLGELLGSDEPATIADFAECEALIKASHLTKQTFAGVRLPEREPGWREITGYGYHVSGHVLSGDLHLALVAAAPVELRCWHRVAGGEPTEINLTALEGGVSHDLGTQRTHSLRPADVGDRARLPVREHGGQHPAAHPDGHRGRRAA